jgi:hypothetical protein
VGVQRAPGDERHAPWAKKHTPGALMCARWAAFMALGSMGYQMGHEEGTGEAAGAAPLQAIPWRAGRRSDGESTRRGCRVGLQVAKNNCCMVLYEA